MSLCIGQNLTLHLNAKHSTSAKSRHNLLGLESSDSSNVSSPIDSGVQLNDCETDHSDDLQADSNNNNNNNQHQHKANNRLSNSYFDRFGYDVSPLDNNATEFEMEHPIKSTVVTVDSSLSEEEKEHQPPNVDVASVDEQIVYRRQKRRKNKSDGPKKRVSFHEDILNSTRVDDVHIEHGFVTMAPPNLTFRGLIGRRWKVPLGRYSWAAEGDAPYFEQSYSDRRQTQSDLILRWSTSSSSSVSNSSIDEEDDSSKDESEDNGRDNEVVRDAPKASRLSYLKRFGSKSISTSIVEEGKNTTTIGSTRESLSSGNILGSLKSMLSFSSSLPASSSIPIAEAQTSDELLAMYSTSQDSPVHKMQQSMSEAELVAPSQISPANARVLDFNKHNLTVSQSEGFHPQCKPNERTDKVLLCDSNVYEHKGISYSYDYDEYKKTLQSHRTLDSQFAETPGGSIYQAIKRWVGFRRTNAQKEDQMAASDAVKEEPNECGLKNVKQLVELSSNNVNTKHLSSPKRKPQQTNLFGTASNKNLVNRVLKNATAKRKLSDLKMRLRSRKLTTQMHWFRLCYIYQGPDEVDSALSEEIRRGLKERKILEAKRSVWELNMPIKSFSFRNKSEVLQAVIPVRSAYSLKGESHQLIVLLTDHTIYIVHNRTNQFVLPYTELGAILVGPHSQTVHLSNTDMDMAFMVHTGCLQLTSWLVGKIEWCMRRHPRRPPLAAVRHMTMRELPHLRYSICHQTAVDHTERFHYYAIVQMQDDENIVASNRRSMLTDIRMEGTLMFMTSAHQQFQMGYFQLYDTHLMVNTMDNEHLTFPLNGGRCQGAKRLSQHQRPHTFQLMLDNRSLIMAAPDEYVASEWLQKLIHVVAMSNAPFSRKSAVLKANRNLSGAQYTALTCTLVMTNEHILAVREVFPSVKQTSSCLGGAPARSKFNVNMAETLACAQIVDMVAFRVPCGQEQNWCILEFSCREVHECTGDWVLYFSTSKEIEIFINTIETLWRYATNSEDGIFPLNTIPETEPLGQKCATIYKGMYNSWSTLSPILQFL